MAKRKRGKSTLSDDEILTRVQAKVAQSVSWFDTKLSKENERIIRYYNSERPFRQHDGNSSYVSSDVYDATEMMKAQLLETFAGGHDIVRFQPRDPRNPQDLDQARVETAYCSEVIFSENDGFGLFHDVMHDGLMARKGVARVYWDEDYTYDTVEFDDLTLDDLHALASQDDVDEIDADLDEDYDPSTDASPTYAGKYVLKVDKCKIVIEPIAPEEFFVEQRVKRREDGIRGQRQLKTRADLIAMGFPKAKVDKCNWDDEKIIDLSPEKLARDNPTNSGNILGYDAIQDEMRHLLLYEVYAKLSLNGDGRAQLYRLLYASSVLFSKEEVEEDPYIEFTPLRIPHTAWGNNYAARVVQTQNARTVLTRGVLDHTASTTNPRYQVVQGALLNPKEMLDNRFGGLVNVNRPDGVIPFPQASLNPFVFEVLSMLKDNKEENTGISSLSQGLNKDAISTQNSQGLVDNLVQLSQIRQKVVARFFAYNFLRPLYLRVWKLAQQHEKKEKVIEIAGSPFVVDPKTWGTERKITVTLHLGYGEMDKEASKYGGAYAELSKDPASVQYFGPQQRYKLLIDSLTKNGISNAADYVLPPDQFMQPPPNPIEMGKVQAMQTTAQAALITAQANSKKSDIAAHHEDLRTQNDTTKVASSVQKQMTDTERQNLETVNRVDIAQREMTMLENAPPAAEKAIVSPRV